MNVTLPSGGRSTTSRSFYEPIDATDRHALLLDYMKALACRNGAMDFVQRRFSKRDEHLSRLRASKVRYDGFFDEDLFRRQYAAFNESVHTSDVIQLLLLFCKVNGGEAYGCEVIREARKELFERPEIQFQAERIIINEEDYHTRLLSGASQYFGLQLDLAFVPPTSLKFLIRGLAKMPPACFHTVLLAAEFAGIYTFYTLLELTRVVLKDQPEVRDALEERLCAVLIDEIGHVTYNRLALGGLGLVAARRLYPLVQDWVGARVHPELKILCARTGVGVPLERFDYAYLPEEVRGNAFFA